MVAGVRPVLPAREGARMSSRPTFAAVLVFALMGCSEQEFTIPADGSILAWYGPGAEDRNHSLLPRGLNGPDVHSCAADPRRAYLAELFVAGGGSAPVNTARGAPGPGPARRAGQPRHRQISPTRPATDTRET